MTQDAPQVGPYRILGRLGAGGMGEVFLAEDTRLGRRVALKTLTGSAAPEQARWKMLREARAAAHLNHPNIAAVYDVLDTGEHAHIVMEYVDGETLAARVQRGALPIALAVDIAVQLAEALVEAHQAGIVHRDLKPANVCITGSGRVKVLDFGLAQGPVVDLTATTGPIEEGGTDRPVVGTPHYLPPEQLRGGAGDARGDIYSLGVTLFELLTGTRPFGGADVVSLVSDVLHAPTPHVRDQRPEVPEPLDAAVFRAMSRRPENRFADARELRHALRAVADGITRPQAPTVPMEPLPVARRSWALAAAGLALVAAAAGGAWWASRDAGRATTPVVVAVLPFAAGAPGPEADPLGAGVSDVLTTTLARLPGITVIARAAVAEEPRPTVAAARKLGATHVVDGRVQGAGDRVRISAQLVDASTAAVVWAGTYEGQARDVLELERGLADELTRAIAPDAARAAERPPTANAEAFADYAQGWSFLDRLDVPGNEQRAADAFRRAIAKDPRFARAHAGLGFALVRAHQRSRRPSDADAARDALTEALRLDPADGSVRCALAALYADAGRRADALEELERAIAAQPRLDEALARRGELLAESGQLERGLASLRDAIRVRPGLWRHHLSLGYVLFNAGRYTEALVPLRRATELQPDAAWPFQMLGTAHHVLGNLPEAIAAYRKATAVGADEKAWDNLGTAYYALGRFPEARDAYLRSVEIEPRSAIAWQNLGDLQRRLGREADSRSAYLRALSEAEAEIAHRPADARARGLCAVALAKLGRAPEAMARAQEAVRLGPPRGDVLHLAATAAAISGHVPESLAWVEAALAAGYSRSLLAEDEFLAPLRRDPRFAALLSTT